MGLHIKTCLLMDEAAVIRSIRDQVFAQEQGIDPLLDWDGLDERCVHLVAFLDQIAIAVSRLREISATAVKLERLAVLPNFRGQGIGSEMVYTAIAYSREQNYTQIMLNAQIQTVEFYQRLGFQAQGQPFDEVGIAHLRMNYQCA